MPNNIVKNTSSSIVQFVVNSVVIFIFYKFLLNTIGAKDIGIWSLVLGISSLSQVAAFGFSGGALKYVAKYLSRQEDEKVSEVIQTSLLSVGVLVGMFVILGYPFLKVFILNVAGIDNLFKIEQILPFGLVSLWMMVLTNVVYSSIDGYQKIFIRNYIYMISSILNLLLCFIVVPEFKLLGLAYLSLIQNFLLVTCGWFLLRRLNERLPCIPCAWNRVIFHEVIGYNVKFQLASFTSMLCEPTTKYFLALYGGTASVGYYDMGSRLAGQIRGVLVSANQALVPVIADYQEQDASKISGIYINSFQLLLFIILPIYCVLMLSVPLISNLWIGSFNDVFMYTLYALFGAHIFNIISNPAYFSNIGTGFLNNNLYAHIGMAISNISLAYFLGLYFNEKGVIISWSLSLIVGSLYIFINFNKKNKIHVNKLLNKQLIKHTMLILTIFLFCSFFLCSFKSHNFYIVNIYVVILFSIGILCYVYKHPYFLKIWNWLKKE